jgi:small subunit ribosomal protein S2
MLNISLRQLLEAGCHFGHQVARWNPKARVFIYSSRENIHIIDLVKTKAGLEAAYNFLKEQLSLGKTVVFVGTKRQAKEFIEEEAKRSSVFYISQRWVGGLITNWEEVKKNLDRIRNLENLIKNEEGIYKKAEVGKFQLELNKLLRLYQGIKDLKSIPDVLFVLDVHRELNCVLEANKVGVKVVGVVDTNSDPTLIDYVIPANDDAVGSIKLIVSLMADAVLEGKEIAEKQNAKEVKKTEKSAKSKTRK